MIPLSLKFGIHDILAASSSSASNTNGRSSPQDLAASSSAYRNTSDRKPAGYCPASLDDLNCSFNVSTLPSSSTNCNINCISSSMSMDGQPIKNKGATRSLCMPTLGRTMCSTLMHLSTKKKCWNRGACVHTSKGRREASFALSVTNTCSRLFLRSCFRKSRPSQLRQIPSPWAFLRALRGKPGWNKGRARGNGRLLRPKLSLRQATRWVRGGWVGGSRLLAAIPLLKSIF